ncbi:choice-of-anchor Q domain-containing protein [Candidatus Halobeggiatoa sp. HSG11]|nr:choice-of-anchor Q domain-containing protein [Candidatus Halobeggiatoa sp. HSG11]
MNYLTFKTELRFIVAILIATLLMIFVPSPLVQAATITVTNNSDSGANSLRQAILDATAGDTINFDADYTITLSSQLDIDKNLTIDGTGQNITISGNNAVRVFDVSSGTVIFNNLTIANGKTNVSTDTNAGAGIRVDSGTTVTVNNSTFSNNSASWDGGAISSSEATLIVNNSTFVGNSTDRYGGGITNYNVISTIINNSTFSNNSAILGTGGIHHTSGTVNLTNTIIAGNTGGDCSGISVSSDNLVEDGSCSATLTGDPLLSTLADNGGDTQTMALQTGSPAIDTGDSGTCESTDQRGETRDASCDIGAYEFPPPKNLVVDNISDVLDADTSSGNNTLREAITYADSGDTITFSSIAGQTITFSSQLTIDKDLTIDGTGQNITLSGDANGNGTADSADTQFFQISSTMTINDLTFTKSYAGADYNGAIRLNSGGDLTINNSTFSDSTGGNISGFIYNDGALTFNNCEFSNNTFNDNSGIVFHQTSQLTFNDSSFSGNSGRVIYISAGSAVTFNNVTANNNAGFLYSHWVDKNINVNNSTIVNNTDIWTGDLVILNIKNSTISNNDKGITNWNTLNLSNTIVANNTTIDCENTGTISTNTNNLIEDNTCSPTVSGDPMLGALADNGGITQTMALQAGSPAIDAGDSGTCESTDQRGETRDASCDIGAYEFIHPPKNLVVDNTSDVLDADTSSGNNTLREAITYADSGDTITFDSSIAGQTITFSSQLTIDKNLTIDGTGQNITLSGDANGNGTADLADTQFFQISSTMTINDLTFTKSYAGADYNGAIRLNSGGDLTINNSTFSDSTGGNISGFFYNDGILTFNNCEFSNNTFNGNSGIVYSYSTLTINNSNFFGNTGKSLYSMGNINVTFNNITVANNNGFFYAIYSDNVININNSTIFNNTNIWEGIRDTDTLNIKNSTISGNDKGIINSGTLHLSNTIIANSTTTDCENTGTISTNTNNLIEDNTCSPTVSGDPMLGALADNGGTTQTMALQTGSPAINAGDNATCEATDQRGETRPKNDTCDIGAYEYELLAPTSLNATTASETQINLSWTDNITNETGFKIERDGILIQTTAADVTSYSDSGPSCETTYSYSVKATDGTVDSIAATASATTSACPVTVLYQLTVSKTGNGTITTSYGIDCGITCEYDYADQIELILTQTPDTGWIFTGWAGDCDDDGAVQINSDKSCSATFIKPNIEISTDTISLTEGISNNGYSLSLNFAPTEPVIITLNGGEKLLFEPESLTFDSSNWNIPQTVQITDINDNLSEGSHEHTISHTISSSDINFNNLQIEDVIVQITDDDSPAVHISTNNVIVNEGGDINSYNIVLTSQPVNDVTIALNTNENTILNPTTLIFTAETWNIPQNITISVEDDSLDEGEHQHDPIQHQVSSADLNYDGLAVNDVTVNVIDNDISSILLSTYTLNINEGDSDNITIALSIIPTQPVTVNLTPEAGITLSPESITFDSNNWNASQTISVTSIEDEIITNEIHTVHINTTSNDLNYNNLAVENLIVNVADNEKPNVLLSSDQITVFEEGTGGNYTLVLTVEPANPVTINLTASEHTQVSPNTLTFTSTNWNIEQTVTVTAVDDELVEEDTHINTITHKVISNDIGYNNLLVTNVTVNIVDEVAQMDLGEIALECQGCTIKNAGTVAIESLPQSTESYSFPTDLIRFELEATETAHVGIYYKNINSLDNFVYRKYGPTTPGNSSTIGWYTFSNVTFELVNNMVKVNLTLTDGQLGDDTGVDGIIIDDGGIAIQEPIAEEDLPPLLEEDLPEGVNLDEITIEDPEVVQENNLPTVCGTSGVCNVGEQTISEEITLGNGGSLSNATFEGDVENQGMIGNSTIGEGVILTGGSLTGTIENEGTIENITFVGSGISGGTLSGNITNESQIGGAITDVELTSGTVVKGGKIGGTITGSPINPPLITDVEVLPGTVLTNIILSPTVKLPDDVILGEGVIIPTEPYQPEDFGIDAEDIANLDAEQFSKLELEALTTFDPEDIADIPPEALTEMGPEQMAVIEGLEGLTEEQFAEIPVEALEGLTKENMSDFSPEVLGEFTPEHVNTLNVKVFQRMPSRNVSKLFVNFNIDTIKPKNIVKLLPEGWDLNLETGELTAPMGAKITPKSLSTSENMPTLPDMNSGFGIGGAGTPLLESSTESLEKENLTEFVLSQEDSGILNVEGIGDSEGKQYAFIPDADDVIQVDTDKTPIGLSVGAGGFYTITTPEGQQYKVVPAPKNPIALAETTDSEVTVGKRGDVMMKSSNRTRSTDVYEIAMFDPFVEDFADNLCIEISPGNLECDGNQRRRSSRAKTRKIQYSDGTAQTIRPTVLSPDVFIEEALKFEGVEQVVYKADGTFAILYQGKPYFVVPDFAVKNERISEAVEPSIVPNDDGSIKYSIAIESETNTRSTEVYEMLSFDPFLEAAPDDLCIEIMPGELECDF